MFYLGAIVSLCYVPGVTGTLIATQWPLLGVLFVAIMLVRHMSGEPLVPKFTPLHAAGLAFLAYAAVNSQFSALPDIGVYGAMLVVVMGLCVWFGTIIENTKGLYAGLAFGGAVSSAIAVAQWLGYHPPIATVSTDAMPGLYVNSVQQGAILVLIAVALVVERMWLWLPPLVPGILLCQSRGAFIALLVGLMAAHYRRLWIFAPPGAVAVVIFLSPLSQSDTMRMQIWQAAWDGLTVFGNGTGIFYAVMLDRPDGIPYFPEYAHNDALQLAFEQGIGALLPLGIVGYALYRSDVKEWPIIVAFVTLGAYSMPLWMPVAAFIGLGAVGRAIRRYGMHGGGGSGSRSRQLERTKLTNNGRRRRAASVAR